MLCVCVVFLCVHIVGMWISFPVHELMVSVMCLPLWISTFLIWVKLSPWTRNSNIWQDWLAIMPQNSLVSLFHITQDTDMSFHLAFIESLKVQIHILMLIQQIFTNQGSPQHTICFVVKNKLNIFYSTFSGILSISKTNWWDREKREGKFTHS